MTSNFKTMKEVLDYDSSVAGKKRIRLLVREDDKTNPVQVKTIVESIFFK